MKHLKEQKIRVMGKYKHQALWSNEFMDQVVKLYDEQGEGSIISLLFP